LQLKKDKVIASKVAIIKKFFIIVLY